MHYAFFDARAELGCMLELLEWVDWMAERADGIAAVSAAWDGAGDLIRPPWVFR
jgi:hypothetical protein